MISSDQNIYVYIYIYIYIYTYIYICMYACISTQWLCGNSCTWAHNESYTLLVPMNKRVLRKLIKAHNKYEWS